MRLAAVPYDAKPLDRAEGRECLNCESAINSYGVGRRHCLACEAKVIEIEGQVASLWEYVRGKIERERSDPEKAHIYSEFVEVATEALGSRILGGYVGEPEEIAHRLSVILPLENPEHTRKAFRRAFRRQENRGVIQRMKDRAGRTIICVNRKIASIWLLPLGVAVPAPAKAISSLGAAVILTVGEIIRAEIGYLPGVEARELHDAGLYAVNHLAAGLPERIWVTETI